MSADDGTFIYSLAGKDQGKLGVRRCRRERRGQGRDADACRGREERQRGQGVIMGGGIRRLGTSGFGLPFRMFLLLGLLSAVLGAAPPPPAGLQAAFVTRTEVALEWGASAGATMYKAEFRLTGAGSFESFGPGATFDRTSLRVGELTKDSGYDFRIYAGNADGWSSQAELLNIVPVDSPQPPTEVTEWAHTETTVSLTWTAPSNPSATHLRVQVSECRKQVGQAECVDGRPCLADRTVVCGDYAPYVEGGVVKEFTATPAIVRNLVKGVTYFFAVEARNLNVRGYENGGSLPVRIVPRGAYEEAPTNLIVTGVEQTKVYLSWEEATGATHYQIQYRISKTSVWLPNTPGYDIITTETSYQVSVPTTDVTYEFRVLARDLFELTPGGYPTSVAWAGDESGDGRLDQHASNIVVGTPVRPLGTPPSGLTVAGYRETEVHMTWTAVSGADYYMLQYKPVDTPDLPLEDWYTFGEQFPVASGAVTNLTTGIAYEFRALAMNSHVATVSYLGYAGPSNIVVATPLARLAAPQELVIISRGTGSLGGCLESSCAINGTSLLASEAILDAGASSDDGFYVGALLRVTSGPAVDESRQVAGYNGATREANFTAPFSSVLGPGTTYELVREPLGEDRATITWLQVNGATKYEVLYRREGRSEEWESAAVLGPSGSEEGSCRRTLPGGQVSPALVEPTTLCYELSGLDLGVKYEVTVVAGSLHLEWGSYPDTTVLLTPVAAPTETPTNAQLVSQDETSGVFTWTPPMNALTSPTSSYMVELKKFGETEFLPSGAAIAIYTDQDVGYRIGGLATGYGYTVRVYAVNLAGTRYPPLEFVLTQPVTGLGVDAVGSACTGPSGSPTCTSHSVFISWTAPSMGNYFKVLARSYTAPGTPATPFQELPVTTNPPYMTSPAVVGPGVTSFFFNTIHYPALQLGAKFTLRVVTSSTASGPFEGIGTDVSFSPAWSVPIEASTLRSPRMSLNSITLSWVPSLLGTDETRPTPEYYVVQLCDSVGCGLYPNSAVGDASSAYRFFGSEATVDQLRGAPLATTEEYNATVYGCNFFDADGDGTRSGDEGCEMVGTSLAAPVRPGGLPPRITDLEVVETHPSMLKVTWSRPGTGGDAAMRYKIMVRESGYPAGEFAVADRVLVRGARIGQCDLSVVPLAEQQLCIRLEQVQYGVSTGPDTCNMTYCLPSFAGRKVFISSGLGAGEYRNITSDDQAGNLMIDYPIVTTQYPPFDAVYNIIGNEDMGELCCPQTNASLTAFLINLQPDTAYQIRVHAGNLNENSFEAVGCDPATGYTIGLPNAVTSISVPYLVGHDSFRLEMDDPGGPSFCGERLFRLYEEVHPAGSGFSVLSGPNAPDGFLNVSRVVQGVGLIEYDIAGTPGPGVASGAYGVPNKYYVRTYCENHLGLATATLPNMRYLDDIYLPGVASAEFTVTLQAPPTEAPSNVTVMYVTSNSLYLEWDVVARATLYRVQIASSPVTKSGPWYTVNQMLGNFTDLATLRVNLALVTGLETGTGAYAARVYAGSIHLTSDGTYTVASPVTEAYTAWPAPNNETDLNVTIHRVTQNSITYNWEHSPGSSVNPTNHMEPVFYLYYRPVFPYNPFNPQPLEPWSGGLNVSSSKSTGCTTVTTVEGGQYIGDAPGCGNITEMNETLGIFSYRHTFSSLQGGVPHQIKVVTFNLNTPRYIRAMYSGVADVCVGGLSEVGNISCTVSGADYIFLQLPASGTDEAYTGLSIKITSGPGIGQIREIIGYLGAEMRAQLDSALSPLTDEFTQIELITDYVVLRGTLSSAESCPAPPCDKVRLGSEALPLADGQLDDYFILFDSGNCTRVMRRIVSFDQTLLSGVNGKLVVMYPPLVCVPAVGDSYRVIEYSKSEKILGGSGGTQQTGPPVAVGLPVPRSVTATSVNLDWPATTQCSDGNGGSTPCVAQVYQVQSRSTHDSSDFPTPGTNFSAEASTTGNIFEFTGLSSMSSYEIRVRAKTLLNDDYGPWSESAFVKLTDSPPLLVATVVDFPTSYYNDRIFLNWTAEANPKQSDRFYIKYGKTQGEVVTYTIDNVPVIYTDDQVCENQGAKLMCQASVTGLQLDTIYYFQVFSGNVKGFEEEGSNFGLSATLALPIAPPDNFELLNLILSGNVSGFAVDLTWQRPFSWPRVTKYYISKQVEGGPFTGISDIVVSDDQVINYRAGNLLKGTQYGFRVHCGNQDGPLGFHIDAETDPTRSNVITVTPVGTPGRALITLAQVTNPDKNSMVRVEWQAPNAGDDAAYYQLGYESCGSADSPNCPSDDAAVITTYTGCTAAHIDCTLNPSCDPMIRICNPPCMGAINEGPASSGQPCNFASSPGIISGLSPGTYYHFFITAGNAAGLGLPSKPFPTQAQIAAAADTRTLVPRTFALPASVTSLKVTEVLEREVKLSWAASSCVGTCIYKVEWSPATAAGNNVTGLKSLVYTHNVDFSLGSVGYTYKVYAGDNATNLYEDFGATVYLPEAARDFKVTHATANSLSFTWTQDPAADTFRVLMSSGLAFRPASSETTSNVAKVQGLSPGLAFNFKVASKTAGLTPYEFVGSNVVRALPSDFAPPPSNLTCIATSATDVRISWDQEEAGPVRYKVEYRPSGGTFGYPQDVEILAGAGLDTYVTGLDPTRSYDFKVYSGSFRGYESSGSNTLTGVQPVGKPTDIAVRGVSRESATIDWKPPKQGQLPQSYRIEYVLDDVVTQIADVQHLGGSLATQSALITPLQQAEHTMRVFSRSQLGFYQPLGSDDVVATPLIVPSGMRVTSVGSNSITLSWIESAELATAPSSLVPVAYRIDFTQTLTRAFNTTADIPVGTTSYTIQGLQTNQEFSFILKAKHVAGAWQSGLGQNPVIATPQGAPSDLAVLLVSASSVSLTWRSPGAGILPASYDITVTKESTGVSFVVSGIQHTGGFSALQGHTVTSLDNGIQYSFIVSTRSATGGMGGITPVPVITTPLQAPSQLAVSDVGSTSVTLTWSPPAASPGQTVPSGYIIVTSKGGASNETDLIPFGSAATVIQGLTSGESYQFCLLAQAPTGDRVNAIGGCVESTPLGNPTTLRVLSTTDSSADLEWEAVAEGMPPDSYVIVSTTAQGLAHETVVASPASSVIQASVTGLDYNKSYSIKVYARTGSFTEPVGTNTLAFSPVGRVEQPRLCSYAQTEVTLQWNAPSASVVPGRYRIGYRPAGCATYQWQACAGQLFTGDIDHRGVGSDTQSGTVFGLLTNMDYEFRVHAKNLVTGDYDPVGSTVVVATARGDRSDFAVQMDGVDGHVLVAPITDLSRRDLFRLTDVTVEAWIRFDAPAAVGKVGVAGNLYSYITQSDNSRGAGYFGYGLYCIHTQVGADLETRCGFEFGSKYDPTGVSSQIDLCSRLALNGANFCGLPGYSKPYRVETSDALLPNQWYHIGGSYDSATGRLLLAVDGMQAAELTASYTTTSGTIAYAQILYTGEEYAYPLSSMYPWQRTDFRIGSLLIGTEAPTVATAQHAFWKGQIDEVRVWSVARGVPEISSTGFRDTVAPLSAGLVAYFPFDDPNYGRTCADETVAVRDSSSSAAPPANLVGGVTVTLSTIPIDQPLVYSASTPEDGTNMTVHVGEALVIEARASDANPSDVIRVTLELPGDPWLHPTNAVFDETFATGATFKWTPMQRDAGKVVTLCFTVTSTLTNPRAPELAGTVPVMKRCITLTVPLCLYMASQGDTIRSIATKFRTNWRTLFLINPELAHPSEVSDGRVLRIGSIYTLRAGDNIEMISARALVPWHSIANNNVALLNRLSTDQQLVKDDAGGVPDAVPSLDPGMAVYDVEFTDLDRSLDYVGKDVCVVAQLNSNCV